MPGIGVYDHGQPAARMLWLELMTRLQSTGVVDGFFGDKWDVNATRNATGDDAWQICNGWCGGISGAVAKAFNAGKDEVKKEAARQIGAGPFFFANIILVKHWAKAGELANNIADVQLWKTSNHSAGPYAGLRWLYFYGARDQQPSHDPANTTSECPQHVVVLFLLIAEPGCFLGCNGWSPDFDRELGEPIAPAKSIDVGSWTRRFASGTVVTWDRETGGSIQWKS